MDSVKIGDQIWSLNNSTLKTFSNGEEIHHSTSKEDWEECGLIEKPALCYYDFYEKNEKYGNWQPKRTYGGPKYLGGYSDHLPVVLDLWMK